MKSILLAALLLGALSANAEPLLLRGVLEDGAFVLKQADVEFLKLVEELMAKAQPGTDFKRVIEGVAATVPTDGAVAVLMAPLTDHGVPMLMNAMLLSEGVAQDLQKTGEAVLRMTFDPSTDTANMPATRLAEILGTLQGVALPVETSATRAAVQSGLAALSQEQAEVMDSLRRTMKIPMILLESPIEQATSVVEGAISELAPLEFGPVFTISMPTSDP